MIGRRNSNEWILPIALIDAFTDVDIQMKKLEFVRLAVAMSPLYIVYHAVIVIYLFVYGAKRWDPEFHVVYTPVFHLQTTVQTSAGEIF